jgi:hypothetical protein
MTQVATALDANSTRETGKPMYGPTADGASGLVARPIQRVASPDPLETSTSDRIGSRQKGELMQNSQAGAWERWYQSAGYAAIGLTVALAMIVLVASSDVTWYLYVPPVLYALLSIERLVRAIRRQRTGLQ